MSTTQDGHSIGTSKVRQETAGPVWLTWCLYQTGNSINNRKQSQRMRTICLLVEKLHRKKQQLEVILHKYTTTREAYHSLIHSSVHTNKARMNACVYQARVCASTNDRPIRTLQIAYTHAHKEGNRSRLSYTARNAWPFWGKVREGRGVRRIRYNIQL